jgi:hypothetical protein
MKMNKFLEAIHDMIEIITGERPETKRNGDRRSEDRGTPDRRLNGTEIKEIKKMMKRARNTDGTYKGDDPTTLDVNEAWTSVFPTREPSMKWTRKQLIDYCNEFGVLHSSDDSKLQLLNKIEDTYPNGL